MYFLLCLWEIEQAWSKNIDVADPVGKIEDEESQGEHSSEEKKKIIFFNV